LLIGVLLAFAYGVLHTLGPGHGKVVVASYFLSRDAQLMRGFLMGLQIAVFHVLSAAVTVALADLVLRQAFGSAPAEVAGVRLASYGLIALIGCSMLVQAVRRSRLRHAGIAVVDECCGHGPQSFLNFSHLAASSSRRSTAGSPRASRPATSRTPRRCSTSWHKRSTFSAVLGQHLEKE
jgi:ABC-type nickel/cobalt efflux system permease component RcnA